MSEVFFISDTHFGHERILELGNGRPFRSISEHDEKIVENWNSVVSPNDTVYHLGDVALGGVQNLEILKVLNGRKLLVPGNHDRLFSGLKKNYREKNRPFYEAAFDEILPEILTIQEARLGGDVRISHFPAFQDSFVEFDKYERFRPEDNGVPLIHGHTHQSSVESLSGNGTPQVSIGVDAWNFTPVNYEQIVDTFLTS